MNHLTKKISFAIFLLSVSCQNSSFQTSLAPVDDQNQGETCSKSFPTQKQKSISQKLLDWDRKLRQTQLLDQPFIQHKVRLSDFQHFAGDSTPSEKTILPQKTSLSILLDRDCALKNSAIEPLNQIQEQLRQPKRKTVSPDQSVSWKTPTRLTLGDLSKRADSIRCIKAISPNLPLQLASVINQATPNLPNDLLYPKLNHLRHVGQELVLKKLFEQIEPRDKIVVAVIDTGNDHLSEDMTGQHWQNLTELNGRAGVDDDGNGYVDDLMAWNFISQTGDPTGTYRPLPHGEHVAGLIGALMNNQKGIAGIAAQRVQVMHLNIFGSGLPGFDPDPLVLLEEALRYAADNGAQVINLSLGRSNLNLQTLQAALKYATDKGLVIAAAAGNNNQEIQADSFPFAPAIIAQNLAGMLSVGALDANPGGTSALCGFSNYSTQYVDLAAPGCDTSVGTIDFGTDGLLSIGWTKNDGVTNPYVHMPGTSMATPLVAGAAALVLSYIHQKTGTFPTNAVVEEILKNGSLVMPHLSQKTNGGGRTLHLPTLFEWIDKEILDLPEGC